MNVKDCKLWVERAGEELEGLNLSRTKKYLRWALSELEEVEE